ncbi:hypothetical protein HDU79_011297 [Rhizoclosmatium sp. JEL0117]|nr:hypothetical protein HDU79_011297 [Rhizoclosmatium sp. JEL0117]
MVGETIILALPALLAATKLYYQGHESLSIALASGCLISLLPRPVKRIPFTTTDMYRIERMKDQGIVPGILLIPFVLSTCLVQLESFGSDPSLKQYIVLLLCINICMSVPKVLLTVKFKGMRILGLVPLMAGVLGGAIYELRGLTNSSILSFEWIVGLLCVATVLSAVSVFHIIHTLKRCFTSGEAMIMSDMLVLFTLDALFATLKKMSPAHIPQILSIPRIPIHIMSQALILGMILIGFLSHPILSNIPSLSAKGAKVDPQTIRLSVLFYAVAAAVVLVIIRPWAILILTEDPFLWLIQFIIEKPINRLGLLVYWALIVMIGVFFAVQNFGAEITENEVKDKSKKGLTYLNFKRKYFHALAVAMFLPGYLIDNDLMHLSFSVALSALILVEYIRVFNVWPIGKDVAGFLRGFLDKKDRGVFILSHLYLLIGCALPVWINRITTASATFHGVYGIITLGIADAAASIVGYKYGKNRWPSSTKTIEGTIAFVASMFGTCILLEAVLGGEGRVLQQFGVALISGLLEAVRSVVNYL